MKYMTQKKRTGDDCKNEKGSVVHSWLTGDDEFNAVSEQYEYGYSRLS